MAHAMATLRAGTVVMYGGWAGVNSNEMFSTCGAIGHRWHLISVGSFSGSRSAEVLFSGQRSHSMAQLGPDRVLMAFGYGVPSTSRIPGFFRQRKGRGGSLEVLTTMDSSIDGHK